MCVYIYIYIYIYVHIERERDIYIYIERERLQYVYLSIQSNVTDGIGTPDPNPTDLVDWRVYNRIKLILHVLNWSSGALVGAGIRFHWL